MASFRKLKSGKWQYRVHDEGREVSKGGFKTKKEAQLAAAAIEEKIYTGQTLGDKHRIMSDFIQEYMEVEKRPNVRRSTYDAYWSAINMHIIPHFGDKKIIKITRPMIKKWMNSYSEMKDQSGKLMYSYGSRLRFASILKGILHSAQHDYKIIGENPMNGLKVPIEKLTIPTNEDEKKIEFYTLTELQQLLSFLKEYKPPRYSEYRPYYMMCFIQSRTGIRISEMLALTWDDIQGDKLSITKQTSRDKNNNLTIEPPKSRAGIRTVKLDPDTIKELKKFRFIQNECAMKYKAFLNHPPLR
ncbi:Arm DNA-binding domain-containing protein, partial [Domibacillus aminovorans]